MGAAFDFIPGARRHADVGTEERPGPTGLPCGQARDRIARDAVLVVRGLAFDDVDKAAGPRAAASGHGASSWRAEGFSKIAGAETDAGTDSEIPGAREEEAHVSSLPHCFRSFDRAALRSLKAPLKASSTGRPFSLSHGRLRCSFNSSRNNLWLAAAPSAANIASPFSSKSDRFFHPIPD